MREIKFRAWYKDTGKPIEDFNRQFMICACNSDLMIVEQFTGLKDKNGKESYEGDRVNFTVFDYNGLDTQYTGVIVFTGQRFQIWQSAESEFYGSDGGFELDWVYAQDEEIEVIGNIHEDKP